MSLPINTIIIPDVHGRTFWRDAVKGNDDARIIFLGDYLDPYPHEGITPDQALEEFKDILEFKKKHPDTVTLLLGNHDLGYLDRDICECRHDYLNEGAIRRLFQEDLDSFDLCLEETTPSRSHVLLSHAGINPKWVSAHAELFPEGTFDAQRFNALFHDAETRHMVLEALADISFYRGGHKAAGSPVWADIHEFTDTEYMDTLQVVGHTRLRDKPVLCGTVLCVDCRKAFTELTDVF